MNQPLLLPSYRLKLLPLDLQLPHFHLLLWWSLQRSMNPRLLLFSQLLNVLVDLFDQPLGILFMSLSSLVIGTNKQSFISGQLGLQFIVDLFCCNNSLFLRLIALFYFISCQPTQRLLYFIFFLQIRNQSVTLLLLFILFSLFLTIVR